MDNFINIKTSSQEKYKTNQNKYQELDHPQVVYKEMQSLKGWNHIWNNIKISNQKKGVECQFVAVILSQKIPILCSK